MTIASQVFAPGSPNVPVSAIGISPQNDNVRIVGLASGQVFATTTGSMGMTNVTGPIPARYIARAVIDPNNVNTAYVTIAGFGVAAGQHVEDHELNNPAPTWVAAGNGIPDVPVNAFVIDLADSNRLFAGTDIGVYSSTDGGANWIPFGTGLPRVAVFDMAIQNNFRLLRIATHGRGIWEISLSSSSLFRRRSDFDSDLRTELGFYRNGLWGFLKSGQSFGLASAQFFSWGGAGLPPIVGDFDGDGKADLGYVAPPAGGQSAVYSILQSSQGYGFGGGQVLFVPAGFPALGDTPVVGILMETEKPIRQFGDHRKVWIIPLSSGNYASFICPMGREWR
jgi:hypothetical protein